MGFHNQKPTIAIYTPFVSGFYLTKVVSEARKIAIQKQLGLMIIITNGFDEFDLPVGIDNIDAAFISLNAIHSSLIAQLQARNIPLISSVDQYASQGVNYIFSHHAQGARLAFEHLLSLGHTRIGCIGDSTVIDSEVRIKAIQQLCKEQNHPLPDEWIIDISALTLSGGSEAASAFIERKLPCTAFFCASDMAAIGFEAALRGIHLKVPDDIAIVGVDNTLLGKTHAPAISSLDQNIPALMESSFQFLLDELNNSHKETTHPPVQQPLRKIPQILHIRQSCGGENSFKPVSREELVSQTARSMQDEHETAMALTDLGYELLPKLSQLWGPFMLWGSVSTFDHADNPRDRQKTQRNSTASFKQEASIKHVRYNQMDMPSWADVPAQQANPLTFSFSRSPDIKESQRALKIVDFFGNLRLSSELIDQAGLVTATEQFPPQQIGSIPLPDHPLLTLLPIKSNDTYWGVLSLVDELKPDMDHDAYDMFYYYLGLMNFFIQRQALADSIKEQAKEAKELAERLEAIAKASNDGIWTWEFEDNTVAWNRRLLEMLGFVSEHDIRIYRNMTFLERVHAEDRDNVERALNAHLQHRLPFKMTFRLQSKSGSFLWVDASGQAIRAPSGKPKRFVGALTDITENTLSRKKMAFLAHHDFLTELPNRTYFTKQVDQHIESLPDSPFAMMLLDLNRFKAFNDSFGHKAGDELLKHVAKSIGASLRKHDHFSRFGSDEFGLMCQVSNRMEAAKLSERIINTLTHDFHYGSFDILITGCLGISLYPQDGKSSETLIKKAEVALSFAKKKQSSHGVFFSREMAADQKKAIAMENELRRAIEHNELYLLLQPQVCTQTGLIVGAEALSRWRSKRYGNVPPGVFITLAEDTGLISLIGEWVLTELLSIAKRWEGTQLENIKLSFNVSPGQILDNNFADRTQRIIEECDVEPHRLCLEITESAAIDDIEHTRHQLQQLSEFGIKISLDDFGTGYSSLSLLNQLPLHWVKIDRSFVTHLNEPKPSQQNLVSSITSMCHALKYQVVAEGVETESQRNAVLDIGCDQIQGYFYSPPIDENAFVEMVVAYQKAAQQASAKTSSERASTQKLVMIQNTPPPSSVNKDDISTHQPATHHSTKNKQNNP